MKKNTIDDEINKVLKRILKLRSIEPKDGVEKRSLELNLRTLASKIVNLEEKKRYAS